MSFHILPKSFFGRNTLMIGALLIISQFISFITIQHFVVDQKNNNIMYLVTNQIKLQYIGAETAIPKNLSRGFSETTELELFWLMGGPLPKGLDSSEHHLAFSNAASTYLGKGTQVKVEFSDRVYVWVNEPSHPEYWIRMPIGEFDGTAPVSLIIF